MSLRFKPAVVFLFAMVAILGCMGGAGAKGVYGVLPFQDTGASPPSRYGNGANPQSELLQASDGNFYGTTTYGGSGICGIDAVPQNIVGCGTIFRINAATGIESVIYSFPYVRHTHSAPNGAYPTAGLIQGQDGALYGVAEDGGIPGCANYLGCGTLFRISTTGAFTLLHQFCGNSGCPGILEGSQPTEHLVQTADGTLYGTTPGYFGGTLFSATTAGAVTTLHDFAIFGDAGFEPQGALLIGSDGRTLYGTTLSGGGGQGGVVFSFGAGGLTVIHTFFETGPAGPVGALIYGADGLLYGTTAGNPTDGATVYSLSTTGSGFLVDATLPGEYTSTGLLLGSDGMMYGTLKAGTSVPDGGLFVYNPTTKTVRGLVQFATASGANPEGALIEGKDNYLYGSNAEGGPSNSFGPAEGTLVRIGPPLPK